ncbi:MAG: AAA domain-containing protein, partial [candidate division Zixibacteria bacterium]|nr:AAA domain-containing protein [candidate division Zixibacteria bacterium]
MSSHLTANIEFIQCCHKYLKGLLGRKDFSAAVRYFESMKNSLDDKSDTERAYFFCLGSRAYTGIGNPTKALGLIRSSIVIFSKTIGDKSKLGQAYMTLGDTLRELGHYNDAEHAFRDAESIFRRDDNISEAGDALNRLAGIFYRKSNFKSSLKCLLGAIEFTRKENNQKKLAYLFGNIGRIYGLLGQFDKAEEYIRFNVDLSRKLKDDIEETRAILSLAYLDIQRYRFDDAKEHLEKALFKIDNNNLAKEKVIHLTYMGELSLKQKKYDLSEKFLTDASTAGFKVAPDSYLAVRPQRWLAELKTAQGSYRKALNIAGKTMIAMKKLGNTAEIGALLKIQAICQEKLDHTKKSVKSYLESIRVLESNRMKIELADALIAAGNSELFEINKRTMFLCRSEDIFADIGASLMVNRLRKKISTTCVNGDLSESISTNKVTINQTPDFITRNKQMKKIISQLQLLKDSDLPILFTGETGVGKDYLAKHFHSLARPQGPYVPVNCAAIPDSLIESELFGHNKGAFTGAESNRQGLFQSANKGVLLLDEIGELPLTLQAKLLSILETRKLRPLGSTEEIELDIRIIAATNRDLSEMVEAGTFRQDLYYRLAGITMELPPLRERKEDIPHLLKAFMQKAGLLDEGIIPEDELTYQFVNYDWPGNIRQMENKVSRLAAMLSIT